MMQWVQRHYYYVKILRHILDEHIIMSRVHWKILECITEAMNPLLRATAIGQHWTNKTNSQSSNIRCTKF